MIDRSYIDFLILIAKPLTEEFCYPWNLIRAVIWGILPIIILSFVTSAIIEPTPEFSDIKNFFQLLWQISSLVALIIYAACSWQAYQVHLDNENEKTSRLRRFQD